jgi:tetratricopeptide (TPR) repeat protein
MKSIKIFKTILLLTFVTSNLFANSDYFKEGLVLYEKKKFDKAKFKFEQDLVFNPKSEKSYLYLSKIFKFRKEKKLEEQNLNTVILLNPKNEEAVYSLAKLKLEESDYEESKKIIDQLLVFCSTYCQKSKNLKIEIENSLKK